MSSEEYQQLHVDLGFAFSLYTASHLDSPLLDHLHGETTIVFQTDDPDYNAYELQLLKRYREVDDDPERAATLIYVTVPHPPRVDDVDWSRAKVLARLVVKPEKEQQRTAV